MNIIYCYVSPHPKALAAVKAYAPQAQLLDTSADLWAYWHEISSRWTGEEDLMTIEQDIEIRAEVVPSFENCPEPWCLYQYQAAGVFSSQGMAEHGPDYRYSLLYKSLGCTRFRKELQQQVPASVIAGQNLTQWPGHVVPSDAGKIRWDRIDYRIEAHFNKLGVKPHVHGEVKHYHTYPKESVNARVQRSIEQYLAFAKTGRCPDIALEVVRSELELARSGELHANPLLLSQQRLEP